MNKRIKWATVIFASLFMVQLLYLTWLELYGKESFIASSYNQRLQIQNTQVKRGEIFDSEGLVLATSVQENGRYKRVYPYGSLYAHVIGYHSNQYGTTQLESRYNTFLMPNQNNLFHQLATYIEQNDMEGDNLHLTIRHALQSQAKALLGNEKGAVVALNPKTGEVLALVSTPDFDPNEDALQKNWQSIIEDFNSPLLPRAVNGLYAPGSTFKVVTAVAAFDKGIQDFSVVDNGAIKIDGKTFKNAGDKAYGQIDLTGALTVSSNVYFASLSEKLGEKALVEAAERVGFNRAQSFDLAVSMSKINRSGMSLTELAATSIGQGKLQVTPMQMALVASAIANDGRVMTPYLVDRITDKTGVVLKKTKPIEAFQWTSDANAKAIEAMMVQVISNGTGKKASVKGVTVAGKTGTAQIENTDLEGELTHGWFIGYAPADNPEIAIAVLLENQTTNGGYNATVLAGKLLKTWFSK